MTGSYTELERLWPFYGLRITWFHWTHNLRIYLGLAPCGKWRLWRPVYRTQPYTLRKSVRLRHESAALLRGDSKE